jgi:CRISPR-associated endonuclease Cas1
MSRPRCDPIDITSALSALASGVTPLSLYRDYASVAARPYARSSWQALVEQARRNGSHVNRQPINHLQPATLQPSPVLLDEASDEHWQKHTPVKPRVRTPLHDNTALRVKGGSLLIFDGDTKLTYEPSSRKPNAIIITGWGGLVSTEAMRFCYDHKIAVILLDWMRDFLTIIAPPSNSSAQLIRSQAYADPVPIARAIVAAKIQTHIAVSALNKSTSTGFLNQLTTANTVSNIMVLEAQAARFVWPSIPAISWRSGTPKVPASWKRPPIMRRNPNGKSPRYAVHPINALLNVCLAVTAGRLATYIVACGLTPAIGFLHTDQKGRNSLVWDAIEPLRPLIECRVFDFIRKHQFGSNDFIQTDEGTIRINDNLLRTVITDTALSVQTLEGVVNWITSLLRSEPRNAVSNLLPPSFPLSLIRRH